MPKTAIVSDKAPQGHGLYSPAVRAGDFIFVSGQVAIDPATDATLADGVADQTRHAFRHIQTLLEAGGATLDDVVKVNSFLARREDYETFSAVYSEFFHEEPVPARTTVSAGQVWDLLVKIDCIAYTGPVSGSP